MFRTIQHLLPRGAAWDTTTPAGGTSPAKRLRQYLEGLAEHYSGIRLFVDLVYLDLLPRTTRQLSTWEKQFGLGSGGPDVDRRAKLAGAWSLQGGQSPDYIQRTLHAAGFTTVYVHEWWYYAPEREVHDPRDYIAQPLIGIYQMEPPGNEWECWEPGPGDPLAPHCDDTLANDPGYLVNLDLTRRAPPPVPDDPARWPFFIYLSGEDFSTPAPVPRSRSAELKELILRLRPAHLWIVMRVVAVDEVEGFGSSEYGSAPYGA
jgi:uncharacterized protein YmfQ (DUF2313 family)